MLLHDASGRCAPSDKHYTLMSLSVVIEELHGDNFKALPDEYLRLSFLYVTRFIFHFEEEMMIIQDLQRHGFLTVSKGGTIEVHNVYLKFA
ncbi:hypothetical protein GOP47_0028561 [Adiantum capillus-veneris]|nr:hypothetical protein GOP47_0028561 [Adiantum capillus-veneris]